VADGIDTPVDAVKAASASASLHGFLAEANRPHLRQRHHAVLVCCQSGESPFDVNGALGLHVTPKAPNDRPCPTQPL